MHHVKVTKHLVKGEPNAEMMQEKLSGIEPNPIKKVYRSIPGLKRRFTAKFKLSERLIKKAKDILNYNSYTEPYFALVKAVRQSLIKYTSTEDYFNLLEELDTLYNNSTDRLDRNEFLYKSLPFHQTNYSEMEKDLLRHVAAVNALKREGVAINCKTFIQIMVDKLPYELMRSANKLIKRIRQYAEQGGPQLTFMAVYKSIQDNIQELQLTYLYKLISGTAHFPNLNNHVRSSSSSRRPMTLIAINPHVNDFFSHTISHWNAIVANLPSFLSPPKFDTLLSISINSL
uniref:Uncharacterized protein n=1 Tax=Caenorhabditis japonica TaxID=281687 RepID=A0A8R1DF14_CAEJA